MMFGKIFSQVFKSTVIELDIAVRYVWFSLLVICDQDGIVDMTPESIARQINAPLETVIEAIRQLSEPDHRSRSPEEDGRRLVPIRDAYGWQIVNYRHYRQMNRAEDRRAYQRDLMRKRRAASKPDPALAGVSTRKQSLGSLADSRGRGRSKRQCVLSDTVRAYGAHYNALAVEWEKSRVRDATLLKRSSLIEKCERDMRAEDGAFTWEEMFRRVGEQASFFRDKWRRWNYSWFIGTKADERNAAKVWHREYQGGRAPSVAPHPDAPDLPGFTV